MTNGQGAAALLPAVPEGARTPIAHPLPLEQDAQPVPDVQHPGLADLLSRHVGGHEEARTCRHASRRAVAVPDTLERRRSRPSPNVQIPGSRPAISRARGQRPGDVVRPKWPSDGPPIWLPGIAGSADKPVDKRQKLDLLCLTKNKNHIAMPSKT